MRGVQESLEVSSFVPSHDLVGLEWPRMAQFPCWLSYEGKGGVPGRGPTTPHL